MLDSIPAHGPQLDEYDIVLDSQAQERARSKLPLILPWHPNETIRLGSVLRSWQQQDPWSKASPFDLKSLIETPVRIIREDGTDATFKSTSTASSLQKRDHLSLGFTAGVGLPFIAEVSVSGKYDKDVMENRDANKISIRATNRAGYVQFDRQPLLSVQGIITIKYDGGLQAFHKRYGDYYVAGYKIGGDTGLMISGTNSARKELEQFGITVKVKVLFVEKSKTWNKDSASSSQESSLSLTGYDTLDHQRWNFGRGATGASVAEIQQHRASIMAKAHSLDERIQGRLNELGFMDGDELTFEDCARLTKSGLVVELVLLPMITLREVVLWLREDNII